VVILHRDEDPELGEPSSWTEVYRTPAVTLARVARRGTRSSRRLSPSIECASVEERQHGRERPRKSLRQPGTTATTSGLIEHTSTQAVGPT
jgi:hypothetical protein